MRSPKRHVNTQRRALRTAAAGVGRSGGAPPDVVGTEDGHWDLEQQLQRAHARQYRDKVALWSSSKAKEHGQELRGRGGVCSLDADWHMLTSAVQCTAPQPGLRLAHPAARQRGAHASRLLRAEHIREVQAPAAQAGALLGSLAPLGQAGHGIAGDGCRERGWRMRRRKSSTAGVCVVDTSTAAAGQLTGPARIRWRRDRHVDPAAAGGAESLWRQLAAPRLRPAPRSAVDRGHAWGPAGRGR